MIKVLTNLFRSFKKSAHSLKNSRKFFRFYKNIKILKFNCIPNFKLFDKKNIQGVLVAIMSILTSS
jgi:hypothetical protein